MNRSLSLSLIATTLCGAAALGTLTLTGCGGSSSTYAPPGGSANHPSSGGRSYTSAVTLANGQTGALSLRTDPNGTVSGTFAIDDNRPARSAEGRVVIATPLLSGTFDSASGAFNLSGSYVFNGRSIPISLTGTLPVPPSTTGGAITVVTDGQTFTSSFMDVPPPSPSATPNPGNPTPLPSPLPNPGNSTFTFTLLGKSADCNFSDAGFASLKVKQAAYSSGTGLYLFGSSLTSTDPRGIISIQLGWQRLKSAGIAPETFTYVPAPAVGPFGDDFQGILQTTIVIPIGQTSAGAWYPSGGRLIIESVSGKTVRIRGENVVFSPNRFNAISATGTFTANFAATYENVTGL